MRYFCRSGGVDTRAKNVSQQMIDSPRHHPQRVATATRIDIDPPFERTVTSGDPSAPGSGPKVPCTPGVLGALYGLPTTSPLTGLDAPATRG